MYELLEVLIKRRPAVVTNNELRVGHRFPRLQTLPRRQPTSRSHDIYSFEAGREIDPDIFTDIIGRHFRQPEEGLGFDGSDSAHMWRTMIWPNNFL
jgi:hypothetical protein